jgi:hypothetical protein
LFGEVPAGALPPGRTGVVLLGGAPLPKSGSPSAPAPAQAASATPAISTDTVRSDRSLIIASLEARHRTLERFSQRRSIAAR